jgi:hypothetical protein
MRTRSLLLALAVIACAWPAAAQVPFGVNPATLAPPVVFNGTAATGLVLVADGTVARPSISFASEPGLGIYKSALGTMSFANDQYDPANPVFTVNSGGRAQLGGSFGVFGFTSTGSSSIAIDTGLSRISAGIVAIGNGTQGDTSGSLQVTSWKAPSLFLIGSGGGSGLIGLGNTAGTIGSVVKIDALPTVASGFGTSPGVTAGSTPFAGSINVGTGGVATTGVINFNGTAYPSAPFCVATNSVSHASPSQAAGTTTQLTLFAATAWPASSIVSWICVSAK